MKKAYLILAEGFELIEAFTPVDVLRRCGVEVVTISLGDTLEVTASNRVTVKADTDFHTERLRDGDLLILPGGYPGYENIGNHPEVMELASYYLREGRLLGAICGAASALAKAGLLSGRSVTAHFSVWDLIPEDSLVREALLVDGNLITASGAGRSLEFALALGEALTDSETITRVKKGMTLI